jgi:DNA-binding transcriptional MocR family regulator
MSEPFFNIRIRRDTREPAHFQIQRGIRLAISTGTLRPMEQLPPVRSLASELGVNRLTVLKALSALKKAGMVIGRRGRGYTVADNPLHKLKGTSEWRPSRRLDQLLHGDEFETPWASKVSRSFDALGPTFQPSGLLSFAAEAPAPDLYPRTELKRLAAGAIGACDPSSFGYVGPDGLPELRERLLERFQRRGVDLTGLELLMTSGAQQALDLLARTIPRRSGIVLTESPTYFGGLVAFERGGFAVAGIPLDGNGINVDALEERLQRAAYDLLYVIPTFHNPTGVTTGDGRRRELLRLAAAHNLLVVEDDAFSEIRFTGKPVKSILQLRGTAKVLQIGSFSKSLMPGLRLGWALGPSEVIGHMRVAKAADDISSSTLSQLMVAHYLASGGYDRHLRRVRREYRKRCTAMVTAIARHFPSEVRHTAPKGGLHVWVVLPERVNAVNVLPVARRAAVDYMPGPVFFPDGRRGTNCLRLNFSTQKVEEIDRGMQILGELFARALGRK